MLIFWWALPQPPKTDTETFEVNMTNQFQDIAKKEFQQQLPLLPHKQILFGNVYIEENHFTFFSRRNILDNR